MNNQSKPTMTLERTANGKIELVIRYATTALRPVLDELGILPDCSIANRRSILCSIAAELDAARNPLRAYFDAKGAWIGGE